MQIHQAPAVPWKCQPLTFKHSDLVVECSSVTERKQEAQFTHKTKVNRYKERKRF